MTLVDVLIGAAILSIAVLGAIAMVPTTNRLQQGLHEREGASLMLQSVSEEVNHWQLAEAFARYNSDPTDDPEGEGSAPGAVFDVEPDYEPALPGLAVGRVQFPPWQWDSGEAVFDETVVDVALGLPRDLDGNGAIEEKAKLKNLLILPVRVSVDWKGVAGEQHIETALILSR